MTLASQTIDDITQQEGQSDMKVVTSLLVSDICIRLLTSPRRQTLFLWYFLPRIALCAGALLFTVCLLKKPMVLGLL